MYLYNVLSRFVVRYTFQTDYTVDRDDHKALQMSKMIKFQISPPISQLQCDKTQNFKEWHRLEHLNRHYKCNHKTHLLYNPDTHSEYKNNICN